MKDKFQTIKIEAKPSKGNTIPRAGDFCLKLSGGQSLGMVQAIQLNASVDSFPKLIIETILNEAELEILQSWTEIKCTLIPNKKKKHEINI